MTNNEREGLRLLGVYTAGRFDIWMLAGNAKASCRAHVMSVLTGERTPQSKAGVNAMVAAFHALAGVAGKGSCAAIREDMFVAWAKEACPAPRVRSDSEACAAFAATMPGWKFAPV